MSDRLIQFRASPALAAWLAHYTPEGGSIHETARAMLIEQMDADFIPDAEYVNRPWTPEEDAIVLSDSLTHREIAAETGRTMDAVKTRRYRLRRSLLG